RRRHTSFSRDWSSDVCSSDLTPLSLISAPLEEIVMSEEGSNQTRQNLLVIEKNCERLSVLINQLLDFRKMDSTEYIVNPEKINQIGRASCREKRQNAGECIVY